MFGVEASPPPPPPVDKTLAVICHMSPRHLDMLLLFFIKCHNCKKVLIAFLPSRQLLIHWSEMHFSSAQNSQSFAYVYLALINFIHVSKDSAQVQYVHQTKATSFFIFHDDVTCSINLSNPRPCINNTSTLVHFSQINFTSLSISKFWPRSGGLPQGFIDNFFSDANLFDYFNSCLKFLLMDFTFNFC